jgi:acyl carrier protein
MEAVGSTAEQLRSLALNMLRTVAPGAELDHLDPDISYRDQFDFDSVDCLNFVLALEKALHVTIPEADYPALGTLHGCVTYLMAKLGYCASPS